MIDLVPLQKPPCEIMEDAETETTPLVGSKQWRSRDRVNRYFMQDISVQNAYLPLLVCCFVTGLIDAGCYSFWSVFMGMQTGRSSLPDKSDILTVHLRQHHLLGLEYSRSSSWH